MKHLSNLKTQIAFLQETHLRPKEITKLKTSWVGEVIASSGQNRKRGVAILLHKRLKYEIISKDIDSEGRYLVVQLQVGSQRLILCNIYGPNTPDKLFWDKMTKKLGEYLNAKLIVGGDFNLISQLPIDRTIEKTKSLKTHYAGTKILKKFRLSLNLKDIWRIQNPDQREYTCESKTYKTFSRIDMFLINEKILGQDLRATISPIIISDHAPISISMSLSPFVLQPNSFFFPKYLYRNIKFSNWLRNMWQQYKNFNENTVSNVEIYWEASKAVIRG